MVVVLLLRMCLLCYAFSLSHFVWGKGKEREGGGGGLGEEEVGGLLALGL